MMRFTVLDLVVLILYMGLVTGWGIWLGRGQTAARQYFLGSRELPWLAVLCSVVATETSTLTFLSIPGLAYATDLGFLQLTIGYLLGRIVVAFVLLPAYYRGELDTAYGLLEKRFGLPTRRFASGVFMVTRSMASGVRLFATAIPVALITGWSYPVSILLIGVFTVLYTYYGGIRSVIWTDALQLAIYLGGALAALAVLVSAVPGGWGGIVSAAADAGKLETFRLGWDISAPYTIWAGILGGAFLAMASHGTDQMIVQRLLTCRSLKQSQAALIGSGVVVMAEFVLFLVIGLSLWHFYGARAFGRSDEIFATFIIEQLPGGMTGLLIAGILATAMSSLSSALNSLSSATTYDIYAPIFGGTERQLLRVGKLFTLFWSFVLVGGALMFRSADTPVVEIGLAIASFTYGGLLGGFFLGILNKRANQRDAIAAIGIGIVVMSTIVFGEAYASLLAGSGLDSVVNALLWLASIAYTWHVVLGTTVTVVAGSLLALTHAAPPRPVPDSVAALSETAHGRATDVGVTA